MRHFPSLFAWKSPVPSAPVFSCVGIVLREGSVAGNLAGWRAAGQRNPALPFREAAGPGMRGQPAGRLRGAEPAGHAHAAPEPGLGAWPRPVEFLLSFLLICQF